MRIFISTGEVSGDTVGALVTEAIRELRPDVDVFGIGGTRMDAAGADIMFQSNHLGTVGITETVAAVRHYPRAFAAVRTAVTLRRPDVAVLIGNDLFHTMLARWLRRRGVKTVSYFPPQVWVWRSLARPIARSFDVMLTSFPEEQSVYEVAARDTRVTFVGHYLSDALERRTPETSAQARTRLGMPREGTVIGLMPGSRDQEVGLLLLPILGAAARLLAHDPSLRFVLPFADSRHRPQIDRAIAAAGIRDCVTIADGSSRDAMAAADLLIVASGTATLEATLMGIPMVIVYRLSRLTTALVYGCIKAGLIDSNVVGLPNRILGARVVPELIQSRVLPDDIADEARRLLLSAERRAAMTAALADAAARVTGGDVVRQVAAHVLAVAR